MRSWVTLTWHVRINVTASKDGAAGRVVSWLNEWGLGIAGQEWRAWHNHYVQHSATEWLPLLLAWKGLSEVVWLGLDLFCFLKCLCVPWLCFALIFAIKACCKCKQCGDHSPKDSAHFFSSPTAPVEYIPHDILRSFLIYLFFSYICFSVSVFSLF